MASRPAESWTDCRRRRGSAAAGQPGLAGAGLGVAAEGHRAARRSAGLDQGGPWGRRSALRGLRGRLRMRPCPATTATDQPSQRGSQNGMEAFYLFLFSEKRGTPGLRRLRRLRCRVCRAPDQPRLGLNTLPTRARTARDVGGGGGEQGGGWHCVERAAHGLPVGPVGLLGLRAPLGLSPVGQVDGRAGRPEDGRTQRHRASQGKQDHGQEGRARRGVDSSPPAVSAGSARYRQGSQPAQRAQHQLPAYPLHGVEKPSATFP